jgi:sulfur carrier protein
VDFPLYTRAKPERYRPDREKPRLGEPGYPILELPVNVSVNGEKREVPAGTTVAGLIRELGLEKAACAAEVNRTLVPKREHAGRELREGDVVELVTLVGGG